MAQEQVEKKKEKRPTALKRDLQNEKRRLLNKTFTSSVKTAIRSFEQTLALKDAAQIKESLNTVYSLMDRGVQRGVFKINKASRTKARLTARAMATA